MPDAPRCPKCGTVAPLRLVSGSVGVDRITYQCQGPSDGPHCGNIYTVEVGALKVDEDRPAA